MSTLQRGNLTAATAPDAGEVLDHLVRERGVAIQQILSGDVDVPVDFDQDFDEWVTVLDGDAVLHVDDEDVVLSTGDWLFLPRHTPHRLVSVRPGTRWLAVTIAAPR